MGFFNRWVRVVGRPFRWLLRVPLPHHALLERKLLEGGPSENLLFELPSDGEILLHHLKLSGPSTVHPQHYFSASDSFATGKRGIAGVPL